MRAYGPSRRKNIPMLTTLHRRLRRVFSSCSITTMVLAAALFGANASPVHADTLARPGEPIILTGADLGALQGIAPGELVAFRYDQTWQQIPVQVDERAMVAFTAIYHDRVERLGA